mmetsp:Transcript_13818/g.20851  ORF Transcript_13818/g.20851 Transcript_13818/m.20851 type:complete len:1038 (+) Transcript_13818:37-3150(+)
MGAITSYPERKGDEIRRIYLEKETDRQRDNEIVFRSYFNHRNMVAASNMMPSVMFTSSFRDTKPKRNIRRTEHLKPILVPQLQIGATHIGHILRGVIVKEGVSTGGIYFVLCDVLGHVIKVGVYGYPVDQKLARSMFYIGRSIGIIEPYLKVPLDGCPFVRVDNKNDVVNEDQPQESVSPLWWKDLGNKICAESKETAIHCYTMGLQSASDSLSVLLCNRSMCHLKLGDYRGAAIDAGVVIRLNPNNKKAYLRLATSLVNLQENFSASLRDLYSEFLRRWPNDKSYLEILGREKKETKGSRDTKTMKSGVLWFESDILFKRLLKPISKVVNSDSKNVNVDKKDGSTKTVMNSVKLKAIGNDFFRLKQYEKAINKYNEAIAVLDASKGVEVTTKLLCNRSFVLLSKHGKESLADSAAAIALSPQNAKAWFRAAVAMENLEKLHMSLITTRKAIALGAKASVLKERLLGKMNQRERHVHRSTESIYEERESLRKELDKECMSTSEMGVANFMLGMLGPTLLGKAFKEDKFNEIPEFHLEYPKHRGWPIGANVNKCVEMLTEEYEKTRYLPYMMEFGYSMGNLSPRDVIKRLHGKGRVNWYFSQRRKLGDICPVFYEGCRTRSNKYTTAVTANFSNSLRKQQVLYGGTVHCAIGFVDLGCLMRASIQESKTGQPLRFIGYDTSAYCVALSLIVWEMIKSSAPAESVCQVWCSAAWAKSTVKYFREALKTAIPQAKIDCSEEVIQLLKHWERSQGVSLSRARELWCKYRTIASGSLAHFKRRKDRLSLGHYQLTGDCFVTDAKVGSTVMWNCPEGCPPPANDQSIFTLVSLEELAKEMKEGKNVMQAAMAIIKTWIEKLKKMAKEKMIVVELHQAAVQDRVSKIAAKSPRTMSWSNILDYMDPNKFHKIAQGCSAENTTHFAYSMNWPTETFGVVPLDYLHRAEFSSNKVEEIFKRARKHVEKMYKTAGASKFLRTPAPENPMNPSCHYLQWKYYKFWSTYFFCQAMQSGIKAKVEDVSMKGYNPIPTTGESSLRDEMVVR